MVRSPAPQRLVIVAEDEILVRMAATMHLADAGFEVLEAEHAAAALDHFEDRSQAVSLLFTDVHMPGDMDGLRLAHHVTRCWPWVRILIASGEARPLTHEMPLRSRFIPKPYDLDHVLGHVRELTD